MLATLVATTVSRLGAGPVMSSQLSPEPQRLPGNRAYQATHALGPHPLSEKECMAQLNRLPYAVVAQSEGFIWCATAKAGTTTILELLNRKFNTAKLPIPPYRYDTKHFLMIPRGAGIELPIPTSIPKISDTNNTDPIPYWPKVVTKREV